MGPEPTEHQVKGIPSGVGKAAEPCGELELGAVAPKQAGRQGTDVDPHGKHTRESRDYRSSAPPPAGRVSRRSFAQFHPIYGRGQRPEVAGHREIRVGRDHFGRRTFARTLHANQCMRLALQLGNEVALEPTPCSAANAASVRFAVPGPFVATATIRPSGIASR